jgi:MFS family permease
VSGSTSRLYAAYVVGLLCLLNAANYGQRMIIAILLPAIKSDVGLSDRQLGILMGGGFALLYAIAGVPLARWADRHARRVFLAGAAVIWSCASGVFGMSQTFLQMLGARIALGIGESICIPTSHSLITDYVSARNRPLALGVHSTGGVVGVTLSLVFGGYLALTHGWRMAMILFALPGLVLAVLVLTTLREPVRERGALDDVAPRLAAVIQHLVSLRSYRFLLLGICFSLLIEFGLNQWLPSFYVRQFGLSVADVGYRYGLAIAIGGIPGSLAGGLLTNWLMRRDERWMVWFPALAYALALPLGLSMLLADSAGVALFLNGLYAFIIYSTSGAFWAACFASVPTRMRATTSAITLLVGGVCGVAVGPMLVGGISDALAVNGDPHALRAALVSIESLAVVVIASLLMAARYLQQERGAVGEPAPIPSVSTAAGTVQ